MRNIASGLTEENILKDEVERYFAAERESMDSDIGYFKLLEKRKLFSSRLLHENSGADRILHTACNGWLLTRRAQAHFAVFLKAQFFKF